MALLRVTDENGNWAEIPAIVGAPGKDGTSVEITRITESTESGGSNIVEFSDGTTLTVRNGKDGEGGSGGGITPHIGENGNWFIGETDTGVRAQGDDYVLTDADKAEIAEQAAEMVDVSSGCLLTVETITIGEKPSEPENIPVTGLTLDLTSYSAQVGGGFYINPVVTPSNATNKAVTWKSSATNIATVDGNGYVTCKAEGNAVITCTTVDGGFTATCAVSVAAADSGGDTEVTLTSISATYSGGDVPVGTAVTDLTGIVVTAHYSDGSTEAVTGYTLPGNIAEGSNTIMVSYGGKTATFTVTGVAESTGGKIQFSTLERKDERVNASGVASAHGDVDSVTIPYTEGMYIRTLFNTTWSASTYPAIIVATDGEYVTPAYTIITNADGSKDVFHIGGKLPHMIEATLTGYAEGSSVIVNMLIGSATNEDMDNSDWLYYIPGGES